MGVLGQVFELGGDVVSPQLAHSLTRLIAEGAGEEDEQADTELRAQAVASYLDLLDKPKLSAVLLKVGMPSIWTTEAQIDGVVWRSMSTHHIMKLHVDRNACISFVYSWWEHPAEDCVCVCVCMGGG